MNKAKSEVPKSANVLQEYTYDQLVYYGLPAIDGWVICCRVFATDDSQSKTLVSGIDKL